MDSKIEARQILGKQVGRFKDAIERYEISHPNMEYDELQLIQSCRKMLYRINNALELLHDR